MIADSFGRTIDYLRLSLTRACEMRCCYCRPKALSHDRSTAAVLTVDEIVFLVRHLVVHHGLKKVRLTGGEPTARPELAEIVCRLSAIEQIGELVMTTNGLALTRQAAVLAHAGLHRVNVSLDSLDPQTFARITGVDGLDRVLSGIDAALAAGLKPVKLNAVVVHGENDHELPELVRFAAARQLEIRLIELMPMGPLAAQWPERFVPAETMRERLTSTVTAWEPLPAGADSARRFSARLCDGRRVVVGFITAMSSPFCGQCNRVRVASDGTFYPCLMGPAAVSLLPSLRPICNDYALDRLLQSHLDAKAAQHPASGAAVMTHLGG